MNRIRKRLIIAGNVKPAPSVPRKAELMTRDEYLNAVAFGGDTKRMQAYARAQERKASQFAS